MRRIFVWIGEDGNETLWGGADGDGNELVGMMKFVLSHAAACWLSATG